MMLARDEMLPGMIWFISWSKDVTPLQSAVPRGMKIIDVFPWFSHEFPGIETLKHPHSGEPEVVYPKKLDIYIFLIRKSLSQSLLKHHGRPFKQRGLSGCTSIHILFPKNWSLHESGRRYQPGVTKDPSSVNDSTPGLMDQIWCGKHWNLWKNWILYIVTIFGDCFAVFLPTIWQYYIHQSYTVGGFKSFYFNPEKLVKILSLTYAHIFSDRWPKTDGMRIGSPLDTMGYFGIPHIGYHCIYTIGFHWIFQSQLETIINPLYTPRWNTHIPSNRIQRLGENAGCGTRASKSFGRGEGDDLPARGGDGGVFQPFRAVNTPF